jgi:hypothetical protein
VHLLARWRGFRVQGWGFTWVLQRGCFNVSVTVLRKLLHSLTANGRWAPEDSRGREAVGGSGLLTFAAHKG